MSATVTVYTKPNCVSCVDSKDLMTELGIQFAEVDISKDKEALARLKALGFRGAPVIETEDTSWGGFNESKIRNLVSANDELTVDDGMWDF